MPRRSDDWVYGGGRWWERLWRQLPSTRLRTWMRMAYVHARWGDSVRGWQKQNGRPYADRRHPTYGRVNIGLMDYKSHDVLCSSRNLGDWIQTLGMMGMLAPHMPADTDGPGVDTLRHFAPGQLGGKARLVALDRDALNAGRDGNGGWAFVHGWHGRRAQGYGVMLPPRGWNPLYIGIYLMTDDLLTDAEWERLRQYEPIGCRDMHTVALMRRRGAKSYFSGCVVQSLRLPRDVSSTLNLGAAPLAIDLRGADNPGKYRLTSHHMPVMRGQTFSANVELAYQRMLAYRDIERVLTTRLHAWLPILAVGGRAELVRPGWLATDARFSGLAGLSQADIIVMGNRLRAGIDRIAPMIMRQDEPAEIYAAWRDYVYANYEVA